MIMRHQNWREVLNFTYDYVKLRSDALGNSK